VGAVLILIFAWTYNFPVERETRQKWDAQNNRWGAPVVTRDEAKPLRWMFSAFAGLALLSGATVVVISRPRKHPGTQKS
jgi:hypothetical protein